MASRYSPNERWERIWRIVDQMGKAIGRDDLSLYTLNPTKSAWTPLNSAKVQGMPFGELTTKQPIGIGFANRDEITGLPVTLVHNFYVVPFPGCCAFAISTGAATHGDYRNKGLNRLGLQMRKEIAASHGYSALICSDIDRNTFSTRTIRGAGFRPIIANFKNRRTTNDVTVYMCEVE